MRYVSNVAIYRALNFKCRQQECICGATFHGETEIYVQCGKCTFHLQSSYHSMIAENNLNL